MKKFHNHLWTKYKSRDYQHCKKCNLVMDSSNIKGNCMSLHEKTEAHRELRLEGRSNTSYANGLYYSSADVFSRVEEIRYRACIN